MGQKLNDSPTHLKLTPDDIESFKSRIKSSALSEQDIDITLSLLELDIWLQDELSQSKLTIKQLRKLFGFKNESRKNRSQSNDSNNNPPDEAADDNQAHGNKPNSSTNDKQPSLAAPQWDANKNHGRIAANDYVGCPVVEVPFEDKLLQDGQCPNCLKCQTHAKLIPEKPQVIVKLDSQPLVSGLRYQLEKARCSVCQAYFTASLPTLPDDTPKFSPRAITSIAIHHYYGCIPFKRIEMLQAAQGVPVPDSTQYDKMNGLYTTVIAPIVNVLYRHAANGDSIYFDDTKGRVIEQMLANKIAVKAKASVHTTALLSEYHGQRIYLFNTNTLAAGKQLEELLSHRTADNEFMTMSDASASNFPKLSDKLLARWIITLCLSHGRRRFVELLNDKDQDIKLILDLIGQVYANEKYCKSHQLDDQQRLKYHQKHSAPVMEGMRVWLNNLMLHDQVEPNSQLGQAITYILKRWRWLTQFLRVPGAALDNNLCEQAIKVAIRYRKNSLFYRTFYGANIGDAMMSLLHTAHHAGINLFDYLNTLQQHVKQVNASPENWLPWNYQQTLNDLNATPTMAINSS